MNTNREEMIFVIRRAIRLMDQGQPFDARTVLTEILEAIDDPDSEPVFELRGQDKCAVGAIRGWAELAAVAGTPVEKVLGAQAAADDILLWQAENRDRVKNPD